MHASLPVLCSGSIGSDLMHSGFLSRSSSPTKLQPRFSPDKVQRRLSPPRKSRFAGKEAADTHDYDGFQQAMLLLFDIIRDRTAARGHVSNDDSVGSPGKDYRSRSGGGGGGGGEFPWQMRKVGGGYKKVLMVPAEVREQASAATANTLRQAGEFMQQQVFVLAQQLVRHRAEALRLADLLQSEQLVRNLRKLCRCPLIAVIPD